MTTRLRDPAHRVSPRALALWHVEAALKAVAAAVALVVVAVVVVPDPWRWVMVAVTLLLCTAGAVVVPQWRYRVHRWEVSETAVYTQRGWWSRERRIAPMSRVQTVDFAQGPLARVCGLATVTVTTASAAGPLQIEGLDQDLAIRLVDELTLKADHDAGDAT